MLMLKIDLMENIQSLREFIALPIFYLIVAGLAIVFNSLLGPLVNYYSMLSSSKDQIKIAKVITRVRIVLTVIIATLIVFSIIVASISKNYFEPFF